MGFKSAGMNGHEWMIMNKKLMELAMAGLD